MNRYLEKLSMTIVDTPKRYGISANKPLNNKYLIDALSNAAHSKEVEVTIIDPSGKKYKAKDVEKVLAGIKEERGTKGWDSQYTWSITMPKDSPRRAPYKTEKGKNFATIAILYRYYNL